MAYIAYSSSTQLTQHTHTPRVCSNNPHPEYMSRSRLKADGNHKFEPLPF